MTRIVTTKAVLCAWAGAVAAVLLWSAPTRADFVGHGASIRDIIVSPDGGRTLTGGFDDLDTSKNSNLLAA